MKIGVKTFNNIEFAEYFADKTDFLEIMAIPGKNYDFLENYPLPIVIHAIHQGFGVNAADANLLEKNLDSINFAIGLADRFGSERIILHPGFLGNNNCSVDQSINLFQELDSRIIFENLPPLSKGLCSRPLEVQEFILKTQRGFCLDINHAIQNIGGGGKDYVGIVKEFITLNPVHYHIGGQRGSKFEDTHLCFEDSTIPLREILNLLPRDAEITLEVTEDIAKTEKDLKLVRSLVG